ncbi:WD repeat-containing protein 70 [Oopsacas minuta]|uniref:WD repeat-containing protein 70 n=1 Tax=Oopsacas minuta TaxID=111878 RepID=A0AAV7JN01_9METZ|nr:WD repeat-containing protein 70 [Oopsacas minuta]
MEQASCNTGSKRARQFDFEQIFQEAHKTARERSHSNKQDLSDYNLNDKLEANIIIPGEVLEDPGSMQVDNSLSTATTSEIYEPERIIPLEDPTTPIVIQSKLERPDIQIGPPIPSNFLPPNSILPSQESGEDSTSSESEEDRTTQSAPPALQLWSQGAHSKLVSTLSFDPSGTRLVSGGYDFNLALWDFTESQANKGGSPHPFRSSEPCESHALLSVAFSTSGDRIMVCPASAEVLVLDRDGKQLATSPKGDQYLSDMAKTKGHVASMRAGAWHPRDKNVLASCGEDCTTRVWEIKKDKLVQTQVLKARDSHGRKTVVSSLCYSMDGKHLATGCRDGSVQIWAGNKSWNSRPNLWNNTAHENGSDLCNLLFCTDSNYLFSRSGDGSVKGWDLRKFKEPVSSNSLLPCSLQHSGLCLSPDGRKLAVSISGSIRGDGAVAFLDRESLQETEKFSFPEVEGVGPLIWQPRLNQLVGGCSGGGVCFLYDVNKSQRGALFFLGEKSTKQPRPKETYVSGGLDSMIITPHSLPLFREKRPWSLKRKREKERQEISISRAPERPVGKQGKGGRLAEGGGSISSYVVKNMALEKVEREVEDPRAAILKYADSAMNNPYFVAPAYKQTQPHSLFKESNQSEEGSGKDTES